MRGCILYKKAAADLPSEAFEIHRLQEEAQHLGIDL